MKKKIISTLLAGAVSLGGVFSVSASEYTGDPVKARLASEEIEGDFMTVWAERFADHMYEWSDGKIEIEVYPYGTLGATGDINELAQLGVVEFVFSDYAWISAFVPQAQVLALNYLFPREQVPQVLDHMMQNGDFFPLLQKHFRDNGLLPMSVLYEGWQWVTTNEPVTSPESLRGQKLRVMSSKLLVEDYKAYGASPTPMSYGEVYGALQTGLIDGQVNPLFAIYSMKFFENQEYITQMWNEPFIGIPTVNLDFYNNLTPDAQQEMLDYWQSAIIPAGDWIEKRNASDMEKMMDEKPSLEFIYLTDEQIQPFEERAKQVYPTFVQIGGDGSQEILDAVLADIAAAEKALGIGQ